MRCALLGPIPGSLPSSSIRSWTGPSNISVRSGPGMPSAPPMPPASGPSCCCARDATCLVASPSAPTSRSCNVSTSSGSTTLGSIFTATTSPLPLTVTSTRPPPALPWTSELMSRSWAAISCCCICCAWASNADMSGWPPGCMTVPLRLGIDLVSPASCGRVRVPSVDGAGLTWRRAHTSSPACRGSRGAGSRRPPRCRRRRTDSPARGRGTRQHRRHDRVPRSRP